MPRTHFQCARWLGVILIESLSPKNNFMSKYIFLLFFTCKSFSLYAHDSDEGEFLPNRPLMDCMADSTEEVCFKKYPVLYRGVIPQKHLNVTVISRNQLCLDIKELKQNQPNIVLETIFGKLLVDLSGETFSFKNETLDVHAHRGNDTNMCAESNGFLVSAPPEFVQLWESAKEENRHTDFIFDLWVSYKHGEWIEWYEFWK